MFPSSLKPEIIYTDCAKEFVKASQDLQWNHDATNGVAERAVRREKEGRAVALVQSEVQEEGWHCAMECYGYSRNVHGQ